MKVFLSPSQIKDFQTRVKHYGDTALSSAFGELDRLTNQTNTEYAKIQRIRNEISSAVSRISSLKREISERKNYYESNTLDRYRDNEGNFVEKKEENPEYERIMSRISDCRYAASSADALYSKYASMLKRADAAIFACKVVFDELKRAKGDFLDLNSDIRSKTSNISEAANSALSIVNAIFSKENSSIPRISQDPVQIDLKAVDNYVIALSTVKNRADDVTVTLNYGINSLHMYWHDSVYDHFNNEYSEVTRSIKNAVAGISGTIQFLKEEKALIMQYLLVSV